MGVQFTKTSRDITLVSFKSRSSASSSSSSLRSLMRTASSMTRLSEWAPFPTDITVIKLDGENVLLVADYSYSMIKVFSSRGNKTIVLPGLPYRLCQVQSDKLAITIPLSKKIVIVSLNEMRIVNVIQTQKMYDGIASSPKWKNALVVGTLRQEPASIEIIDMTGKVLKSFTHDPQGNAICITPSFLAATPSGDILISDHSSHALICISQKGQIKWRHQPHKGDNFLQDPTGVVCHDSDFIFLVDRLQRCVFKFSTAGWCYGQVIFIHKITCDPFSISTDSNGTIYVGLGDGTIEVYPDQDGSMAPPVRTSIEIPRRRGFKR